MDCMNWWILINLLRFYINYLEPKSKSSLLASLLPLKPEIEKMINKDKNASELNWGSKSLTDDDLATIAYYLLKSNKVSILFKTKDAYSLLFTFIYLFQVLKIILFCERMRNSSESECLKIRRKIRRFSILKAVRSFWCMFKCQLKLKIKDDAI